MIYGVDQSTTLPAPAAELRAVVVVPAKDEELLISACIEALGSQSGIASGAYEVLVVLDDCADDTEAATLRAAASCPGLVLHLLRADGRGVGAARALGMERGCERLLAVGQPLGLIASTDADSRVAPDWLLQQLAAVADGAEAVGGEIFLDPAGSEGLSDDTLSRRRSDHSRRRSELSAAGVSDHIHFSGASMGVTARAFATVGGLEPLSSLEDEEFFRRLARGGIEVQRLSSVRVTTSARTEGRAARGLSSDLALGEWLANRTWSAEQFSVERVLATKNRTVSVVLPAREVASTIGRTLDQLAPLRDAGLIDEVLVVDADSADGTAGVAEARGARAVNESALRPEMGPCAGKGDAMWRGAAEATGEVIVFCDADSEDFDASFVFGLLGPLFCEPQLRFVKGAFRRPLKVGDETIPDGGGRVTELVARPLLNLHFPQLAGFAQPLAGEVAIDRDLFEKLSVPSGYGVEVAMLIDACRLCGLGALGQVDLGERQNRHQSLQALGVMALEVMVAAQSRIDRAGSTGAGAAGRELLGAQPLPTRLISASPGGETTSRAANCEERPPLAESPRLSLT